MNDLQVFTNPELGQVRIVTIDGEPYFVGKDIAEILGYSNTRDALAKHVDEDDKITVAFHDGNKGNPNQVIINESGKEVSDFLYSKGFYVSESSLQRHADRLKKEK